MIRSNRINHKQFNLFLDSKFGKNLLNGLLDVIAGNGSTNPLAQFIRENNAYEKAMSQQKKDEFMIIKREPLTD